MIGDKYLHIYVGRGMKGKDINWSTKGSRKNKASWVGHVYGRQIRHYEVSNFKYGDRLLFYNYNRGGYGFLYFGMVNIIQQIKRIL